MAKTKKKEGRCSTEQVEKCHGKGKAAAHICAPDGDPGKCSPRQVKKCHGDVENHPCIGEKQE